MADTSATSELNKKTVAAAANQCLESFRKCLLRESSIHPREFSLVEDQVARFSTWTSGIGVFALGRASMDHRLRYAPEVQSITISLLESLNYRIQKLLEILHTHANGPETHISSILNKGLEKFLGYVATEISHLNKMSNIIRKASQDSQNVQAKDYHMRDEDGSDVEPILLSHYNRYISDRFPTASVTIQQRLADAMILRRKRILYRRSRYGITAIQLPKVETKVSITLPDSLLRPEDNQKAMAPSHIKSATTLQPEKFKMAATSPSVVSATMTVALGNHEALTFPIAPGLHAKRKYEQFKAGQLAAHQAMLGKSDAASSAADPTLDHDVDMRDAQERSAAEEQLSNILKPDVPAIGEITCPYCLYTLPVEDVFNKQKWQNHVKNDLDPYVCLFEECSEPDELYKHSDKWLSHMHQHIQRWRCPSHRELGLFLTCEGYMQHMRDVHDTKFKDAKLRALAKRNSRSLPKLFLSCPLCGKDESEIGSRLTDHITGHLRSLAIRSLPSHYDDIPGDVGSDEDSSNSSRPRSRSTINLLDDEENREFWSTMNEDADDTAVGSTAVEGTINDEEGLTDEFLKHDYAHKDPVPHSDHVGVDKAETISPGLNDEEISGINTLLEDETIYGFNMVSDDTDMWNPQQEQTHAPQKDSSDVAGPSNEEDMSPKKPQCWECVRRDSPCDGRIPICDNCSDAGMVCPGYSNTRPLTWLPTNKVSRLQKAKNQSDSSSNRSESGKSDVDDRQNITSLDRVSGENIIVGNNTRAEAERKPIYSQPMQKPTPDQLRLAVSQTILQNMRPMNNITWQPDVSTSERMKKARELVSNICLAMNSGLDWKRAVEFGCQFEREIFDKSPTKESYSQAMANKTIEFYKKRQANEGYPQNNTSTDTQAQTQAQAPLLQSQTLHGGMAMSHSPGVNTLDAPVTRSDNISLMVPQGMDEATVQLGDQGVHQGIQSPDNAAIGAMFDSMTPQQRQSINGLPKEKLDEVWRRWQSQHQKQMHTMNRNPTMQPQTASQPQAILHGNAAGIGNQQQPQAERIAPPQGPQLALLMDSMDVPPSIINQIAGLPVEVKKWKDLKSWTIQNNNNIPQHTRNQLLALQQKQYQMTLQRRIDNLPQQPQQALNINSGIPTQTNQQTRPIPSNIPPELLQVSTQEMMHIRNQKPGLANVPDEQLRNIISTMKKTSWQQQQQQLRVRQAQSAQVHANQQQPMEAPQADQQEMQP